MILVFPICVFLKSATMKEREREREKKKVSSRNERSRKRRESRHKSGATFPSACAKRAFRRCLFFAREKMSSKNTLAFFASPRGRLFPVASPLDAARVVWRLLLFPFHLLDVTEKARRHLVPPDKALRATETRRIEKRESVL